MLDEKELAAIEDRLKLRETFLGVSDDLERAEDSSALDQITVRDYRDLLAEVRRLQGLVRAAANNFEFADMRDRLLLARQYRAAVPPAPAAGPTEGMDLRRCIMEMNFEFDAPTGISQKAADRMALQEAIRILQNDEQGCTSWVEIPAAERAEPTE